MYIVNACTTDFWKSLKKGPKFSTKSPLHPLYSKQQFQFDEEMVEYAANWTTKKGRRNKASSEGDPTNKVKDSQWSNELIWNDELAN